MFGRIANRMSYLRRFATYYTVDHEWLEYNKGTQVGLIGITKHAQEKLGEVVCIELPEINSKCKQGEVIGDVDSTGVVDHIYSPISGIVVEVNRKLKFAPALLNTSPTDEGWVAKIKINDEEELGNLMDEVAYQKHVDEELYGK